VQLALRLFYSFRSPGADRLILGDISRFFPNRELATFAFEMFDKDENGDATKVGSFNSIRLYINNFIECANGASQEEIEATVLEMHTERMALAASMKDIDSATSRLDDILMALYGLIVILIFAIMLVSVHTGLHNTGILITMLRMSPGRTNFEHRYRRRHFCSRPVLAHWSNCSRRWVLVLSSSSPTHLVHSFFLCFPYCVLQSWQASSSSSSSILTI
jgi:hypothetical protein